MVCKRAEITNGDHLNQFDGSQEEVGVSGYLIS